MPIPSQGELKELTSGERIYPGHIYEHTRVDHESRYLFAERYITNNDHVLDAACGSGYGSAMLADKAAAVTGIDISEHAIDFARKNFQKDSTDFLIADLSKKIEFPNGKFDRIVSFETFEHLPNPASLLQEFQRLLKPGGLLIMSTPEKELIQRVDPDNKFHIHEVTKDEFVAELSKFFKIEAFFGKNPYKTLSFSQRLIKGVVKFFILIDVFKLHRMLVPQRFKAPIIGSMEPSSEQDLTEMHQLDINAPNKIYLDLIAVCRKQ